MVLNNNECKEISTILVVILFSVVLLLVTGLPMESAGQSEEERVAKLIDGAKKEKKLVLYTTMNMSDSTAMLKKFTEKYPFIKTELFRLAGQKMLNKIFVEANAKRYIPDVFGVGGFQTYLIQKKGLYSRYVSPESKAYQEGFKDPMGYWTTLYINQYLMGYNTRLLSRKDIPDTYEGFLHPKFKGKKIGFDTKEVEWFANMLKIMGEAKGIEFMKKFAAQELEYRSGHTLIASLIIAGEFPVGTVYLSRLDQKKSDGAPIEWVGVAPVIAKIEPVGIAAHAPNPNAAKLYIDFVLSKEGQKLIASFDRFPGRTDIEVEVVKAFKKIKSYPSDISLAEKYQEYYDQFCDIFKFAR